MVHGAVISEDPPALAFRRQRVEHRIARRAAQTFANPINETDDEDVLPRCGKCDERPYETREGVARQHKGPAPPGAVGPLTRHQLEDARRRIGRAFDEPERRRIPAEDARDEHRQERVGGFGCRISQETRVAEEFDRTR